MSRPRPGRALRRPGAAGPGRPGPRCRRLVGTGMTDRRRPPGALTCLAVEGRFLQAADAAGLRAEATRAEAEGAAALFVSAGALGDPIVLAAALAPVVPRLLLGAPDRVGPRRPSSRAAGPRPHVPRPCLRGPERPLLRPAVRCATGRGHLPLPGPVAFGGSGQRRSRVIRSERRRTAPGRRGRGAH